MVTGFRYVRAVVLLLLFPSISLSAQDSSHVVAPQESGQSGLAPSTYELSVRLRELYAAEPPLAGNDVTQQVRQFYALGGFLPVWTTESGPTANAQIGLSLLLEASRYGLSAAEYEAGPLRALVDSLRTAPTHPQQRLNAEVRLTTALIRFSQHLSHGRLDNSLVRPEQILEENRLNAAAHLAQALSGSQFERQILAAQPNGRSYVRLLWAWQRLLQTDTAAARRLALPVALNLERLRWEPRPDSLYVVVNIPAYTLQVVRGAQVVRTHRVVVGKSATPTPELYSTINFFQTAPEWRMPHSIATKEMLPRLKRDASYLNSRSLRLYDQAGTRVNAARIDWSSVTPATFPYQIRQGSSSRNALGNVVFRFMNPYEIYLHDTPERKLFLADNRALSHGCIRVQQAWALARFLVQRDSNKGPADRLEKMSNSLYTGETTALRLSAPVPLIIRYQTCDADGPQLRQLPDIYQLDKAVAEAWNNLAPEFPEAASVR